MGSAPALDRLRQSLSNVTWRETLGKGTNFVVSLNGEGSRLPFFCVHSLTGKATDYVPLAQRLGPDQPFFALQIPLACRTTDFGGVIAPLTIESLARHYVTEVTARRPDGPIALGGWSIGAIIALEMAQQLKAQGRDVALLVIIDMIPWNYAFPPGSGIWRAADTVLQTPSWLAAHKLVRNGVKLGVLAERARLKLAAVAARLAGHPAPPFEEVVGDLVDVNRYAPGHLALMEHLFADAQTYVAQHYDGPVQIYAATADVALQHRARLKWGWRHIAPAARLNAVPGAHQTLFLGPGGDILAAHLGKHLAALTPAAL
jgi:thioesterase domain-containing protein